MSAGRFQMLVLSRPASPEQEAEYNDWYNNTHIPQILKLPGFVAARRFKLSVDMADGAAWPYMAIYEIEDEDPQAAFKRLEAAALDGTIAHGIAFDYPSVHASIYQPIFATASQ